MPNNHPNRSKAARRLRDAAPVLLAHAELCTGPEMITFRSMCREGSDVADVLDAIINSARAAIKTAKGE